MEPASAEQGRLEKGLSVNVPTSAIRKVNEREVTAHTDGKGK